MTGSVYWAVVAKVHPDMTAEPLMFGTSFAVKLAISEGVRALRDLGHADTGQVMVYCHHDHKPGEVCPVVPADTTGQPCPNVCHYWEAMELARRGNLI